MLSSVTLTSQAFPSDRPFNNAANWGGTGLMEMPTARILGDGVIRFGYAQALPYRWVTIGMGIFPGLEFGGRLTEIANIPSGLGDDYGANKDKAFDLKYQILPESKRFPAIAIGIHDFHGTKLFPAEYLVFNRQIYPLDFTLGVGRKRLAGSPTDETNYRLFGGIEWAISKRINLILEYSSINYKQDRYSARGVPEGAEWPVNIGARMKVMPGFDLGLSLQRGNTFGFMGHLQLELGKSMRPKRADPPLWAPVNRTTFEMRDSQKMVKQIKRAIHSAGFSGINVYTDGKNLTAEFANGKYLSNQKAVGRVLRILLFYSPKDTERIIAVLTRRQIPMLKVSVRPDYFEDYLLGKISEHTFHEHMIVETSDKSPNSGTDNLIKTRPNKAGFAFGLKPDFQTYLNDPSGFFKFRVGIKPFLIATPWEGGAFSVRFNIPFYSDISSSNIPPPDAVYSDSWKYLGRHYTFDRLILDHTFRISRKTFGKIHVGLFDDMYGGVGGEILTFLGEGNLAFGIEGDWVKKRKPNTLFEFLEYNRHTILGNLYYQINSISTIVELKYGRFLGEDIGWRLSVSREYKSGVILGAWYSFTDTDHFKESYNQGYHDKGVFMKLPVRMLSSYETQSRYTYAMSPWTRDVAGVVSHWDDLMGIGADLMPAHFKSSLHKLKE